MVVRVVVMVTGGSISVTVTVVGLGTIPRSTEIVITYIRITFL